MSKVSVLEVVEAAINSVQDQLGEERTSFTLEDGTVVDITPPRPNVYDESEEEEDYYESSEEYYDSSC